MKIEQTTSAKVPASRGAGRARPGADAAFATRLGSALGGSAPASTGSLGPLASLSSVLAVQAAEELDTVAERRRRAIRRGESLLDGLGMLHRALLDGEPTRRTLDELRDRLRARGEEIDDPDLAELLREIEVRVAVELAKREIPD